MIVEETSTARTNPFYQLGGNLPADAPSYVRRAADVDLLSHLTAGLFCYVLTSRQMGKSSLMVQTAKRLREAGTAVAVLDLTMIGQNLSPEQWYDGLLIPLGREFHLEEELDDFWNSDDPAIAKLGPMQRWITAVREVILRSVKSRIVVFVDEIDAVRGLPFSTDEFFAGIRQMYNDRTRDPELERITFCLLGVAKPSDLIRNVNTTPFNVGQRVELTDFTEAEAQPLLAGLGRDEETGRQLLRRLLWWTGGHPYLTQRLCAWIAEDFSVKSDADVDRVCEDTFLSSRAREKDDNLLFVRERMLRSEVDRASLLDMYGRILVGKKVSDDDSSSIVDTLRLAGVVIVSGNRLVVRNRIYAYVFDQQWIRNNMPDAELRRQREAYRRGVWRASSVAAVVLAAMFSLWLYARRQADAARAQRERAEQSQYASDLHLAQEAADTGNLGRADALLDRYIPKPGAEDFRGIEWGLLAWIDRGDSDRTYNGFGDEVRSVTYSPDGTTIAAASPDGTLRLFRNDRNDPIILHPAGPGVMSVAFSPDGKQLVAATGNWKSSRVPGEVLLWSINPAAADYGLEGQAPHVLAHQDAAINSVQFSPNGRYLASGDESNTVLVWDTRSLNQPMRRYPAHKNGNGVNSVAFSSDSRVLAAASGNGTLQAWDVTGNASLEDAMAQVSGIMSMAFLPKSKRVILGTRDGPIVIWDLTQHKATGGIKETSQGLVNSIAFSHDGRQFATGGSNCTIKLWDSATLAYLGMLSGHRDMVFTVAFSPHGDHLISGAADRSIKLWTIPPRLPGSVLRHDGAVTGIAFSPDGKLIASALGPREKGAQKPDGSVAIWSTSSGQRLFTLDDPARIVWSVAFSPDGSKLAAAGDDGVVTIWSMQSRAQLATLTGHTEPVTFVAFSPDGSLVVTTSRDGTARLWDARFTAAQPKPIFIIQKGAFKNRDWGHDSWVRCATFSPNSQMLATTSSDRTVQLWDLHTHVQIAKLTGYAGAVNAATFSPDGRTLASASTDRTVRLWDIAGAKFNQGDATVLQGYSAALNTVAFSPDGRTLAAGSSDSAVMLWNVKTQEEVMALTGHSGGILDLAFSPSNDLLATASNDNTVRLWRALPANATPAPAQGWSTP